MAVGSFARISPTHSGSSNPKLYRSPSIGASTAGSELLVRRKGMGFDIGYADGIRDGVRATISEAAGGSNAEVHLGRLKGALERPYNFPYAWQSYNCTENHDFVLDMDGDHRKPRIPKLADWNDSRSWYARSR